MASIRFFIRPGKNKSNPTNIILRFVEGRKIDLHAKTQLIILPNFWKTNKKGEVILTDGYSEKDKLKYKLELLRRFVSDSYNEEEFKEDLTSDWLKTTIDKYFNPEKYKHKTITFYEFIDHFIKMVAADRTPGTLKQYRNAKNRFKEFDKFRKQETTFQSVNMEWYHDFKDYSIREKNLQNNSIAKYIKMLKTFMREADEDGISVNPAYCSKNFIKPSNESTSIYLTDAEIRSIIKLDLTKKPIEEITRDLFVFGCQTGLRYSDYTNVKKENIRGNILTITTIKTNAIVHVPIDSIANNILQKYNYQLPAAPVNQKFNEYLKGIGLFAKITEPIQIVKKVGAMRHETTVKKFMLIQSHTARRSFATNCYFDKVPLQYIMKLTGHKTEKAFMRYLNLKGIKAAQDMAKHPRFAQNNSQLKVV